MKRAVTHPITDEALQSLSSYSWPRNARQLQHAIDKLVTITPSGKTISARGVHEVLTDLTRFQTGAQVPAVFRNEDSLDEFLARTLIGLYDHFMALTGSHSEVAKILGIHRNSLYQRIDRARRRLNGDRCAIGRRHSMNV